MPTSTGKFYPNPARSDADVYIPRLGPAEKPTAKSKSPSWLTYDPVDAVSACEESSLFWQLSIAGRVRVLEQLLQKRGLTLEVIDIMYGAVSNDQQLDNQNTLKRVEALSCGMKPALLVNNREILEVGMYERYKQKHRICYLPHELAMELKLTRRVKVVCYVLSSEYRRLLEVSYNRYRAYSFVERVTIQPALRQIREILGNRSEQK